MEKEKINMYEFSFLTNMVDQCIEIFLSGKTPDECFNKIEVLSNDYNKKLSQEQILKLLGDAKVLFINYFMLVDKYEKLSSKKEEYSINDICKEYINMRNKIILANKNMLSKYYLSLENKIIIELQNIGNKLNINENSKKSIKIKVNM